MSTADCTFVRQELYTMSIILYILMAIAFIPELFNEKR